VVDRSVFLQLFQCHHNCGENRNFPDDRVALCNEPSCFVQGFIAQFNFFRQCGKRGLHPIMNLCFWSGFCLRQNQPGNFRGCLPKIHALDPRRKIPVPITLLRDEIPIHNARAVRRFPHKHRTIVVEDFPPYAGIESSGIGVVLREVFALANHAPQNLDVLRHKVTAELYDFGSLKLERTLRVKTKISRRSQRERGRLARDFKTKHQADELSALRSSMASGRIDRFDMEFFHDFLWRFFPKIGLVV
jgi:hypothetical protein